MHPYSGFNRGPLHTHRHRCVEQVRVGRTQGGSETAHAIAKIVRESGRCLRLKNEKFINGYGESFTTLMCRKS